ncbi:hypothetical protein EJB05_45127, partial [Eragrostis curvula]
MAQAVSSVLYLWLLLLLLPLLGRGSTYRTTLSADSRRLIVQSSHGAPTPEETCSSVLSGMANGNRLPLLHRSSPCSPLNDRAGKPSADVLDRDARRLRTIYAAVCSSHVDAPPPAPAPGVTVPVAVTDIPVLKGGLDYSVMVGFGTPAQQLPMDFDTLDIPEGVSTLRCKPCRNSSGPCDPAFDPATSSTFARVPCGPECPSRCDGSTTTCSLNVTDSHGAVYVNGSFVKDTLTLSSSATFASFILACTDVDNYTRNRQHNWRLLLLPASVDASTRGFLTIGGSGTLPDLSGDGAVSTPLVDFPGNRNSYVIELGGINVGGKELPAPQPSLAALDVGTSFTFLKPQIYTALRDEFRKRMPPYPVAPPPHPVLDTCYNFTGLPGFEVPAVWLEFKGGVTLTPDVDQMMYFPDGPFSVGCLAFAATSEEFPFSVIGNMAQQTVEVVYDVRGRKVGFIKGSC